MNFDEKIKKISTEASFKYIFFPLLDVLDNLTIQWKHDVKYYSGSHPWVKGFHWSLEIVKVGGIIYKIDEDPSLLFNKIKDEISGARIDLAILLPDFRDRIAGLVEKFKWMIDGEEAFAEAVKKKHVKIEDLGYPKVVYADDLLLGGSFAPPKDVEEMIKSGKTERPLVDSKLLYSELKERFADFYVELTRLLLFIEHQINLNSLLNEGISNSSDEKKELLDLLAKNKIDELLSKLKQIPMYMNDPEWVSLSARYHRMVEERRKGIIKREDFNQDMSRLTSDLLEFISMR